MIAAAFALVISVAAYFFGKSLAYLVACVFSVPKGRKRRTLYKALLGWLPWCLPLVCLLPGMFLERSGKSYVGSSGVLAELIYLAGLCVAAFLVPFDMSRALQRALDVSECHTAQDERAARFWGWIVFGLCFVVLWLKFSFG